jgi:hypothetical protein
MKAKNDYIIIASAVLFLQIVKDENHVHHMSNNDHKTLPCLHWTKKANEK